MSQYRELKAECYEANMEIPRKNLAIYTFGNVSAADHHRGIFAVKPSGVPYDELRTEDIVVCDFDGELIEGTLNPSSDTPTHAVLYREFPGITAVVHTHSPYAVGWAQSLEPLVIYGTTHADHCAGDIPCTPPMSDEAIEGNYEVETGRQIVNHLADKGLSHQDVEMILVGGHGPFTWGKTPAKAVYNAVVLEEIAKMALITRTVNPEAPRLKDALIRKHYQRKHGPDAYYGQGKGKERTSSC